MCLSIYLSLYLSVYVPISMSRSLFISIYLSFSFSISPLEQLPPRAPLDRRRHGQRVPWRAHVQHPDWRLGQHDSLPLGAFLFCASACMHAHPHREIPPVAAAAASAAAAAAAAAASHFCVSQ